MKTFPFINTNTLGGRHRQFAFTLMELLVVVGLVSVLAAVIGVALRGGDASVGIRTGQRIAASMVQATRAQAVLKQTQARLIIHNDRSDHEKYLRYLGIIYKALPTGSEWIAANQGTYLPKGIYFHKESSTGTGESMSIEFPRLNAVAEGTGESWLYYEFGSTGTFQKAGSKFVLAVGVPTIDPSSTDTVIEYKDETMSGFVIHRLGSISIALDPSDL